MRSSNAIVKRLVEGGSLKKKEFANRLGISSPAVIDWTNGAAKFPKKRIADCAEISDHPQRKMLGLLLLLCKLEEEGFTGELTRLLNMK